ncbi:MAG: phospholipid carrier-dependent glycosyltransferase [bacterium]|nr:phospholipid carrier-dependent glycosyltransferase [bacterium]
MQLRLHSYGWLIGVLVVAAFAMLFRLGDRPVENWDEGIHGAVSIDMVERGDWVTPWYAGGTYFRKPPLKLWMSAGLFEAFGINAWTLRLPSALAGIATALLVAWWMWQWRRSRWEAFLAGVIVATMRPIFFHAFRTGEMDGLLTLFTTGALYCWWRATTDIALAEHEIRNQKPEFRTSNFGIDSPFGFRHSSFRWLLLTGAAIGLAVMTKSAAGILPIPIIVMHAFLTGSWRRIRVRDVIVLVLVSVLVAAPWHLAMTVIHGMTFWNDYVGWHVVKRATEVLHNETAGVWWWYLPTFARRFTPYTYWFVPALLYSILGVLHALRQRGKSTLNHSPLVIPHSSFSTQTLLLIWFFLGFIGFTAARTKFDWYLLPMYPAAIMLTVRFLTSARDAIANRWIAALHLIAIAAFTLTLPAMFPTGTITDRIIEQWYALFGHPIILAAIVTIAIAGIITATSRRWGVMVTSRLAYVIVMVLVLVPGLTVTARHLRAREPEGPFPAIAATVRGSNGTLVSYGLDYKQSPAGYFILRSTLRDDVRVLDGRTDSARAAAMLRERDRGFLLTKRETELPEELRHVVDDPRTFGDFTVWERR